LIFQNEALNLSKEKLHFHTIQFLEKKERFQYNYKPYGSGVLIKIQDHYLVFTASHVTGNIGNGSLYFNTRIGVQQVVGSYYETDIEIDKHTDLAYIILDRMLGLLLSETYQFLPLTNICHSHIPKETTNYMVCGYPEKNIWEDEGDIYTGSSHFLVCMANQKIYTYYQLDLNKNYAVNFAGRGIDLTTCNKSNKIDDPYGMSGCGLWFLRARAIAGKMILDYFLIGIMTMIKKYKYHVLIGNKIEPIMIDLERIGLFNFDWKTLSK
jgi:hypothetical protein